MFQPHCKGAGGTATQVGKPWEQEQEDQGCNWGVTLD